MDITCEIQGTEYLNHEHQNIIMSNHESALDMLLGLACLPYNIVFLVKKELFKIPIFGWITQAAGMTKIDRQNKEMAKQSVDLAVNKLTNFKFSTLYILRGRDQKQKKYCLLKMVVLFLQSDRNYPLCPLPLLVRGLYYQ